MTANNDGQTKGGEEDVSKNGISKHPSSDTEPGSLAERPTGDKPPPKNRDLADDAAPTFQVIYFAV